MWYVWYMMEAHHVVRVVHDGGPPCGACGTMMVAHHVVRVVHDGGPPCGVCGT